MMSKAAAAIDVHAHDTAWVYACTRDDAARSAWADGLECAEIAGVRAAFDGVLFDRDAQARSFGVRAHDATPAQLFAEAYARLGDRCFDSFSGHYAVIVEDLRQRRVIAARDKMGLFPLFFATGSAGRCFISPSTDALLSKPGVSRALNRVALAEHLLHRWSDASETYFEDIRRIPPGHVLEIDENGAGMLRRYWDPGDGAIEWLREDELGLFDEALERAVTRSLTRGRSAIFLSGGFDSISIAAVAVDAAKRLGHPLPRALSLGFPDPACNEEYVQRGVARSLGMPQDFVAFADAVGHRGLLEPAAEWAAGWPAPMMNLWNPAYYALGQRGRADGCSVILTGSGGDEWLSVSPYLSADLMRAGDAGGVLRLIGVLQRSYRISRAEAIQSALWTFGAKPLAGMTINRAAPGYWRARRRMKIVRSTPAWVAPDPALRRVVDERAERVLAAPDPPRGFYEQNMRTALDHPLMAMEAEEYFEFGRRLGAAIVHPYWDSDLVELLYRTPPSLLTRGGRAKGIVRDTIARRFPTLGFERQRKVHATNFYWTTLQREGSAVWSKVRAAAALSELGIVDAAAVGGTIAELVAGRRPPESYRIWNVLNLETWTRSRLSTAQ
jgi:asparagine synthase (glutamine-hydrolysing)